MTLLQMDLLGQKMCRFCLLIFVRFKWPMLRNTVIENTYLNFDPFAGLKMLTLQLRLMGLDDKENIVSRFEDAFKNMWVNNGNALR